jgi:hypothetical protein
MGIMTALSSHHVQEDKKQTDDKKSDSEVKQEPKMTSYKTEKGKTVEADLLLDCAGARANSDCMREHFASSIAKNGRIEVEHLAARGDQFELTVFCLLQGC